MRQDSFSDAGFEKYRNKESGMSQLRQTDYWIVHIGIQASAHAFSDSKSILFSVQPRIRHFLGKRIKWLILPLHESETDRHLIGLSG
jgi:hypothetical protein